MKRAFLGRRSRCGAEGHSTSSTGPESSVPGASSGRSGAGLRPAGAAAGLAPFAAGVDSGGFGVNAYTIGVGPPNTIASFGISSASLMLVVTISAVAVMPGRSSSSELSTSRTVS